MQQENRLAENTVLSKFIRDRTRWFMLNNVGLLTSDIGSVDYVDGYKPSENELQSLTPIFCDNIVMLRIFPQSLLKTGDGKLMLSEEAMNINRQVVLCGLRNNGVKVENCNLTHTLVKAISDLDRESYEVREVCKKLQDEFDNEELYGCRFKVSTANNDYSVLAEAMQKCNYEFFKNNIVLVETDITCDFTSIFRRDDVVEFLMSKHGFSYEGDGNQNDRHILDNIDRVGINCLTWMDNTNHNYTKRCKIYNKFICQVTSPGVRSSFGNHIFDVMFSPDEQLKNTFRIDKAKECGITRIEITFYSDTFPSVVERDKIMTETRSLFIGNNLFYDISTGDQWKRLLSHVNRSCILHDKVNKQLQICFYVNSITGKTTGIMIDKDKDIDDDSVLDQVRYYSYVCLPMYLVVVDQMNDEMTWSIKKYIKYAGNTFMSNGTSLRSVREEEIDPSSVGLVETKHCKIDYFRDKKRVDIFVGNEPVDVQPLFVTLQEFKKNHKHAVVTLKESEEVISKRFEFGVQHKKIFDECMERIRRERIEAANLARQRRRREQVELQNENIVTWMGDRFYSYNATPNLSLGRYYQDLHTNDPLSISVDFMYDFNGYYSIHDVELNMWFIVQGIECDFINDHKDRLRTLPLRGKNLVLYQNDGNVFHIFWRFNVNNSYTTRTSVVAAISNEVLIFDNEVRNEKSFGKVIPNHVANPMLRMDVRGASCIVPNGSLITSSKADKMIMLKVQQEYLVTHLIRFELRNKDRYYLRLKDNYRLYISNTFFEEMLSNNPNLYNTQFILIPTGLGWTKSRNHEMTFAFKNI